MKTLEMQARSRLLQRQAHLLNRPSESDGAPSDRDELTDIEVALQKIDDGRYGDCESCGSAVGRQRLTAIPDARFCISCAESTVVTAAL